MRFGGEAGNSLAESTSQFVAPSRKVRLKRIIHRGLPRDCPISAKRLPPSRPSVAAIREIRGGEPPVAPEDPWFGQHAFHHTAGFRPLTPENGAHEDATRSARTPA